MENFDLLPTGEKRSLLKKAEYIIGTTYGDSLACLYLFNGTFIERRLVSSREEEEREVISIVNGSEIEKYLDHISILHIL